MALTLANREFHSAGSQRQTVLQATFDSSYATGGEALSAQALGMKTVSLVTAEPSGGYSFEYDYTNAKLKAFRSAGFTPAGTVAAPTFTGSALASHVHDLRIIGGQAAAGTDTVQGALGDLILGKEEATNAVIAGANEATKGGVVGVTAGTPAGTNNAPAFTGTAVAAAVLVEVASAVDLSAVTTRVTAFGY